MRPVACDLCQGTDYSVLFQTNDYITGKPQTVVKCDACSTVYVNPQPSGNEFSEYYPQIYYGEEPFLYEKLDASSRYRRIGKLVSKGDRVLDVGCGRGLFLHRLKQAGCEVWGTELSEFSSKYARNKLGLDVLTANLEECDFPDNHFNVITMFHSLEHMTSPCTTLREIHRILKPGGILLVEVPAFDSLHSRIFRERWFHLDVPRHLYHFTYPTLSLLLTRSGFTPFRTRRSGLLYDAFGALQSLLNLGCSRMNLLNDLNTKRITLKEISQNGPKGLMREAVVSLAAQSVLFVPLLGLSAILGLFGIGGVLVVYSRKI